MQIIPFVCLPSGQLQAASFTIGRSPIRLRFGAQLYCSAKVVARTTSLGGASGSTSLLVICSPAYSA